VVENAARQIDRRLVLHQVRVDGVAAGEHAARDQHDIANLERADLRLGNRRAERDLAARPRKTGRQGFRRQERDRWNGGVAVQP